MKRFIRENIANILAVLGLLLLLSIFTLSLVSCEKKDTLNETIPSVVEPVEIEVYVTEVGVDLQEYTDVLLWLLLNPDDDYKFYYSEGMLYELKVSTNVIEEWYLNDVIQQVVESLTPEEIEGLTASINGR